MLPTWTQVIQPGLKCNQQCILISIIKKSEAVGLTSSISIVMYVLPITIFIIIIIKWCAWWRRLDSHLNMACFSDVCMGGSVMSNANLSIFYQNVRRLGTKQLEFLDNIYMTNFDITGLRHGSTTSANFTIYFLVHTLFTSLTGHIWTRILVVAF